ncbi:UrvD/REP family ATP-dependent DNA helicase [Arcanobacterium ihumii]|uniref:UrvD/REP family ATP-dependent DNA helicase n=1 Tax=Arcanobacterium ihumii TaxID=2138162 RepID=UPI000F54B125|nr:ATP-dependent DNA helicase [Arcanobacterium ihumii]
MIVTLDSTQLDVIDRCVSPCALSVIGAPGSGKTEVLKQAVAKVIEANPMARVAVLSPDRRAASQLRNELSVALGGLSEFISVQSINAFSFRIISEYAQRSGRQEPELISGPDQDVVLKEIFDLIEEGVIPLKDYELVADGVSQLPAYRAEFRDLITRAAELGLSADDLHDLGQKFERPAWVMGSKIMTAYEGALAVQASSYSQNPDRVDHARLMSNATGVLQAWESSIEGSGSLGSLLSKPHWDWVFVDDVQDATLSLLKLLRQLQDDGASIVTFGDPDVAVQGFRGGISHLPSMLTRSKNDLGIDAEQLILGQVYRGNEQIRTICQRIASGIHVAGVSRHRSARFWDEDDSENNDSVKVMTSVHFSAMIEQIGAEFRRLHLEESIPYGEMAIITRSNAIHSAMRRALIRMGIPVESINSALPLREQPAVRALLDLLHLAIDDPATIEINDVERVITGRLFEIDPIQLRRTKRELRGWELLAGGTRLENELLLEIVNNPRADVLRKIPQIARIAGLIGKIRLTHGRGASADEVLWTAWNSLGVAEKWRATALGTGILADTANNDLDSIIQLFRVAQRLTDRKMQSVGIDRFLENMELQDLPEDSIAQTGATNEEVSLCTPASTIGRSWDYVVIAQVNQGVWPNAKLRNPLTRVPELVSVVVGSVLSGGTVTAEQSVSEVVDDELRMLLQSVSRARTSVTITAEENSETMPSTFIQWLDRVEELERYEVSDTEALSANIDSVVGVLRRISVLNLAKASEKAKNLLDELSKAGIKEADSTNWVDQFEWTTTEAIEDGKVRISPSKVESILECPLREFFRMIGADSTEDTVKADVGTLIHKIAEDYPRGPREVMLEVLSREWSGLGLDNSLLWNQILFDNAQKMVEKLADYFAQAPQGVQTELRAEYSSEDFVVAGRIDRIEFELNSPERVVVVDLKTGKSAPAKDSLATHPQLLTYQWLVNNGAVKSEGNYPQPHESAGAKLVHLGMQGKTFKESKQDVATDVDLTLAEQNFINVAQLSRGPNILAQPNAKCQYCSFQTICPAQKGSRLFS